MPAWVAAQAPLAGHDPGGAASKALQRALDAYGRGEALGSPDLRALPESHARVIRLLEGFHLWGFLGDAKRQAAARRAVAAEARALGVDPARALSAPVSYRWIPGEAPRRHPGGRGIVFQARPRSRGLDAGGVPLRVIRVDRGAGTEGAQARPAVQGTRRVVTDTALWWPAYQAAYLDLGYRWLPNLIETRLGADGAPPLRFWVIGYEDGSQVFLLAALIEGAIDRLKQRMESLAAAQRSRSPEPERRRLDELRIEIVATDLGLRLARDGRVFRLAGFEPDGQPDEASGSAPPHQVANLTISELGPVVAQKARAEVDQLEDQVSDLRRIPAEKLDELADAGKIGILFERFFRPGLGVRYSSSSPRFDYHLHNDRWRIEDTEGVLNEGATWSMTFSLADVTKAEPPKDIDLVLVTNVLPWLKLYADAFDEEIAELPLERAWSRIQRSLRPGGWILIDPRSEKVLDPAWAASRAGGAKGELVIVTTAVGTRRASRRYMTGEPIVSVETETVFVDTRCVTVSDRKDLNAARAECDAAVAAAGFGSGFIRPCDPIDKDDLPQGSCETCSGSAETLWLCFGVPEAPEVAH